MATTITLVPTTTTNKSSSRFRQTSFGTSTNSTSVSSPVAPLSRGQVRRPRDPSSGSPSYSTSHSASNHANSSSPHSCTTRVPHTTATPPPTRLTPITPLCTYRSAFSNALITFMPPASILDAILDFLFWSYVQDSPSTPFSKHSHRSHPDLRRFARTRLVSRVWNLAFMNYVRTRLRSSTSRNNQPSSTSDVYYSLLNPYYTSAFADPQHGLASAPTPTFTGTRSTVPNLGHQTDGIRYSVNSDVNSDGKGEGIRKRGALGMYPHGDIGLSTSINENSTSNVLGQRAFISNENEAATLTKTSYDCTGSGDAASSHLGILSRDQQNTGYQDAYHQSKLNTAPVISPMDLEIEPELHNSTSLSGAPLELPPPLIRRDSAYNNIATSSSSSSLSPPPLSSSSASPSESSLSCLPPTPSDSHQHLQLHQHRNYYSSRSEPTHTSRTRSLSLSDPSLSYVLASAVDYYADETETDEETSDYFCINTSQSSSLRSEYRVNANVNSGVETSDHRSMCDGNFGDEDQMDVDVDWYP